MQEEDLRRAIEAATSVAVSNGLIVDDAIVLQNSNKLALRLLPCDVQARVELTEDQRGAQSEVDLARRLAAVGAPVGVLEPRVAPGPHRLGGFTITLWSFYEVGPDLSPAWYADALRRLHQGMRTVDVEVPHAADRVASALRLVADRECSPDLPEEERELLVDTLHQLGPVLGSSGEGQLLHGEPHPGNVLATRHGPLFIDLETCCRGPVEFDLAHAADEVATHYPGADDELLRQCRILVLAMITAWRWHRDDQLPDGRGLAAEWLGELRTMLESDS